MPNRISRIFRDAFDLTGLASPEQVMFVGDNPRTDIDGAKRFGMKTGWVRRGRRFPTDLQPPDHVIDHVAELTISLFRQATLRDAWGDAQRGCGKRGRG